MTDDELTAEEIADFKSLDADELARVGKFNKWLSTQKPADPAADPQKSGLSKPPSPDALPALTIAQLKTLISDPETSSILKHWLAQAEESLKNPPSKKPVESPLRKALRVI
jgi:hypothetical protein